MCCGLGLGQSGMVTWELLGSKAGAVWGGQPCGRALTAESPPLPWPGKPKPTLNVHLTPSLKRPPSSRGQGPSSGLPDPAPLPPCGAPSSQLQNLPFSRWPTAGLAKWLPDVAGMAAGWLHRAEVAAPAQSWGLAPRGGMCLVSLGATCPNNPSCLPLPSNIPSLPTSVGCCFHNRKIKSIRRCGKMSVGSALASNSSIVSGLAGLRAGSTHSY